MDDIPTSSGGEFQAQRSTSTVSPSSIFTTSGSIPSVFHFSSRSTQNSRATPSSSTSTENIPITSSRPTRPPDTQTILPIIRTPAFIIRSPISMTEICSSHSQPTQTSVSTTTASTSTTSCQATQTDRPFININPIFQEASFNAIENEEQEFDALYLPQREEGLQDVNLQDSNLQAPNEQSPNGEGSNIQVEHAYSNATNTSPNISFAQMSNANAEASHRQCPHKYRPFSGFAPFPRSSCPHSSQPQISRPLARRVQTPQRRLPQMQDLRLQFCRVGQPHDFYIHNDDIGRHVEFLRNYCNDFTEEGEQILEYILNCSRLLENHVRSTPEGLQQTTTLEYGRFWKSLAVAELYLLRMYKQKLRAGRTGRTDE